MAKARRSGRVATSILRGISIADPEAVQAELERVGVTLSDLVTLTGLRDDLGANHRVYIDPRSGLAISASGAMGGAYDGVSALRYVTGERGGTLKIDNASFEASKESETRVSAVGTRMLLDQVRFAQRQKRPVEIATYAAGSGDGGYIRNGQIHANRIENTQYSGFTVWPRNGYEFRDNAQFHTARDWAVNDAKKLIEKGRIEGSLNAATVTKYGLRVNSFSRAQSIGEAMKTKEGRTFWTAFGTGDGMQFDATPGSVSVQTLKAYAKERGISSRGLK